MYVPGRFREMWTDGVSEVTVQNSASSRLSFCMVYVVPDPTSHHVRSHVILFDRAYGSHH